MNTETDDRFTMLRMKIYNNKLKFLSSNTFKNIIIVFGMALSLFTITSFDTVSQADATATNIENQEFDEELMDSNVQLDSESATQKNNQKIKTHHNFIASYLLQESSGKRKIKKTDDQGDFIGHIIQLHKIIISKALGPF